MKTFTNLAEHVFFSNSWPYEGTTEWIEVINKPNPVEPFSVNLHILVHATPLKNTPIPDLCHITTLKPLRNTADFFCTHSLTSFVIVQSPQFVAAIFAAARPSEVVHTRARTRQQCWCTWRRGLTGSDWLSHCLTNISRPEQSWDKNIWSRFNNIYTYIYIHIHRYVNMS